MFTSISRRSGRRTRTTVLAGAVATSALTLLVGCGSTSTPGSPAAAPSVDPSTSSAPATSGTPSSGSTSATVVSLKLLMFGPTNLTVKVGTKVTWRNDEPITHTVTSGQFLGVDKKTGLRSSAKPNGLFNAKLAGKGDTFSYTFTKPGSYPYYCDIHEGMNATITVTG